MKKSFPKIETAASGPSLCLRNPLAYLLAALLIGSTFVCRAARADYQSRLELGFGIVTLNSPSETDAVISAEYEYRTRPKLGLGVSASYIFASQGGITLLAVPDFFLHPLGGEWLVSVAPLFEFGPGSASNLGFKFGTRLPIPIGSIQLIPEIAVDIIANGPYLLFGLGIGF